MDLLVEDNQIAASKDRIVTRTSLPEIPALCGPFEGRGGKLGTAYIHHGDLQAMRRKPVAYLTETLEAIINGHTMSKITPWRFRKISSTAQ